MATVPVAIAVLTTFCTWPGSVYASSLSSASPPLTSRVVNNVVDVNRNTIRPIGTTNARYASWTIDSSYNRGFVHINFDNPNLLAGAESLSPSTIRFGGGGNDYLHYFAAEPCNSDNDNDNYVCLNETHWTSLYKMANKSGTDFVFGLSFDMIDACTKNASYVWNPADAIGMIKYIISQKHVIWGYELGNEVNNRHFKCNLEPAQQAAAFASLSKALVQLYPDTSTRPKILGPDVGYLESETWLGGFLGNYSSLDAVTYHVYSGVNKKNFNEPNTIDHALGDLSWYPDMVRQLAHGAEIWAGEDGPIGGGEDGTCNNGGTESACGTYATVLWYANDLGIRALHGFKQYQRQTLIGGRYGLMGIPHDNEALGPTDSVRINPDFWVMFLWKRLVGLNVFNATSRTHSLDSSIRLYGYMGSPPSKYSPPEMMEGNPLTLVVVNIANSTKEIHLDSNTVSIDNRDSEFFSWTLTPAAGPFGETSMLNGHALQSDFSNGVAIQEIPIPAFKSGPDVKLPAYSVSFVVSTTQSQ